MDILFQKLKDTVGFFSNVATDPPIIYRGIFGFLLLFRQIGHLRFDHGKLGGKKRQLILFFEAEASFGFAGIVQKKKPRAGGRDDQG